MTVECEKKNIHHLIVVFLKILKVLADIRTKNPDLYLEIIIGLDYLLGGNALKKLEKSIYYLQHLMRKGDAPSPLP